MRPSPPLSSTVDSKWPAALLRVQGEFRPGSAQQIIDWVAVSVLAIASLLLAGFAIRTYRQSGWTLANEGQLAKSVILALGAYFVLRRLGLKYVFGQGTVRAYNTWGLMWSEDLTGVVGARYIGERSTPTIEISWPGRRRRLELFKSLRHELDALVETAKPPPPESADDEEEGEDDRGPPWICPACHEENPGNFGECWKCQRLRERESGALT
jgi:hypothetical protein